ncbi:polysaccharide pyruvyl transferase family protein [Vreelandella stevensii]|uniref:polysaccharide pyruvyl transferase family protein n=1 Tax=Vreelandella stevensii TaxID=502821 RepID=UPI00403A8DA7
MDLKNSDMLKHILDTAKYYSDEGQTAYYPNPGNAGDSLIAAATYQVFKNAGLNYQLCKKNDPLTGKFLILGGGGNLVPQYNSIRYMLERAHNVAARVVVLPHTIRGNEDLIAKCDERVEFFCRDVVSYEHVIQHVSKAKAYLAHDMAFGLDVEQFFANQKIISAADKLIDEKVKDTPLERLFSRADSRCFFRRDKEGTSRLIPKSSIDLSALFKQGVWPGKANVSAAAILRFVDRYKEIHSDRLHVGIAASLLSKNVYLYNNSYSKNKVIYEHSLHQNFPKTSYVD